MTGRPEATVVIGSHLDSVPAGPGINDNGSGSATILQLALLVARLNMTLKNRFRFAWWGAEELGNLSLSLSLSTQTPLKLNSTATMLGVGDDKHKELSLLLFIVELSPFLLPTFFSITLSFVLILTLSFFRSICPLYNQIQDSWVLQLMCNLSTPPN